MALDQLVERSLAIRTPDRRYVLLETLRAFGAEQLDRDGRADVVGERHARHYVEWIEAAERRMMESAHHGNVTEIDAALPELRAALEWLLVHEDLALAGRLVSSLLDYGLLRLRPDVMAWAERVTAADPHDRSPSPRSCGRSAGTPPGWPGTSQRPTPALPGLAPIAARSGRAAAAERVHAQR